MSDHPIRTAADAMRDDALLEALTRFAAGESTQAEADAMRERLRNDPAAMDALILVTCQAESIRQLAGAAPAPTESKPDLSTAKVRTASPFAPIAYAAAAALILSAAAVAIYLFATQPNAETENSAPGRTIATLVDATGTVMVDDELAVSGGQLRPGVYTMADGSASFVLTSGAWVELHGACRFIVHDDMSATLDHGTAAFRCPPSAVGYTVYLGGGLSVVDLGTAFTVRVEPDGARLVGVTEGSVRIDGAAGPGSVVTAGLVGVASPDGVVKPGVSDEQWRALYPDGVMANAALHQPAEQSSDHGSKLFIAPNAVDGRLDTSTHTAGSFRRGGGDPDYSPRWTVDLGRLTDVYRIVLHNRDTAPARLRDLHVEVLGEDGQTVVWQSPLINPENTLESPARIDVDPIAATGGAVRGRFVRISRIADRDRSGDPDGKSVEDIAVLSLAEVEVLTPADPDTETVEKAIPGEPQ